MDGEEHEINFNCLHYYYIDVKSFRKSKTEIRINSVGDAEFFIKVIAEKKKSTVLLIQFIASRERNFCSQIFQKVITRNIMK